MNFLQADIVFPITSEPIENGVLVVDDKGVIIEIMNPLTDGDLPSEIKKYSGFLCPGFVNMHCHLELSHLKGKFKEKSGLVNFINEMRLNRSNENSKEAILQADHDMFESGIVAVGDISNTADTLSVKKKSPIYYHTFVELFDVVPGRSEKVFTEGKFLAQQFSDKGLSNSLVPHAPYTVTAALLSLLSKSYFNSAQLSTIHNQETKDEDFLFHSQSGAMFDFLIGLNPVLGNHIYENNSSLEFILDHLHHFEKLLLVHNTFTKEEHIKDALAFSDEIFWCLCPNANLYIENKLPEIELFRKNKCKITIGTDSYASNSSLSILEEIKTLSQNFKEISLEEILKWATLNGANFLGKDDVLGSFERGKCPGIVLIENVDSLNKKVVSNSTSRRLDA